MSFHWKHLCAVLCCPCFLFIWQFFIELRWKLTS